MKRKLSDSIEFFRTDRPSEWMMDEYMREARHYESLLERCRAAISEAGYEDFDTGLINEIDKIV